MEYLIIANRNGNEYTANIFKKSNSLFDVIKEATNELETITSENVTTFLKGRIVTNYLSYVEDIMRTMGFRRCDVCGEWITPQDIRSGASTWNSRTRTRKCPSCVARDMEYVLNLDGYHSTSCDVRVINGADENFTLSNVLGIGIEFEYFNNTDNTDYIKCTKAFYDIANDRCLNKMFRLERDCTVTGEIISNVFTKKTLYDFDWSIITDVLKLNGNIEGNDEAGLHVHFSKLWLGTTAKEQCLNFLKLQYFMKSYEYDFLKMSGRNPDRMNYCKFFTLSEIEAMKNNIIRRDDPWWYMPEDHGGGVGCALNSSGATIEYRIGRNTNDPERIKHYLRFLLGIVENIRNVDFSKCYCIGKVTRLVPNDTMNYWRKQGCFLKTNATDERGVTLVY